MPLDIDPAWEYWEPDPEIAEVLAMAPGASAKDRLFGDVPDTPHKYATGMRFGCGNPNLFWDREVRDDLWVRAEEIIRRGSRVDPRSRVKDDGVFCTMWLSGATVREIMARFGIEHVLTVRRHRDRLGLPARRVGRHSREANAVC